MHLLSTLTFLFSLLMVLTTSSAAELELATKPFGVTASCSGLPLSVSRPTSSSGRLTNSAVYQARFIADDWSGQLLKFTFDGTGKLDTAAHWDAANNIPSAHNRKIISYDNGVGVVFQTSSLTADSLAVIGGEDIVDYIRGVHTKEQRFNNGSYRNRHRLLGDIVHSSPHYVGAPAQHYPDSFTTPSYSTFKTRHKNRIGVIYVGANDGMLHAFHAETGEELFAYVPQAVFGKLSLLANPDYDHQYYVDATPTIMDAFINGSWKTILVSGLGAGGQGIFALDVTDPTTISAANVLWEFTNKDSAALGYTFGEPSIIKLNNGKWAALFSGGYNSIIGDPQLYLLDLATGEEIATFALSASTANGFATPVAVDFNGDNIADAIYVGDLAGNLWKIDIGKNATWDFSFGTTPLFKASDSSGNNQPITSRPVVVRHKRTGYLVLFGTGKLLEDSDNSQHNQTTQSFYAVWDNGSPVTRNGLVEQTIQTNINSNGTNYRVTSRNPVDWVSKQGWYLDLDASVGERQISHPITRNGNIIFSTYIPTTDRCTTSEPGWLMELKLYTGARLNHSPFDVNEDGIINAQDRVSISGNNAAASECTQDCIAVSGAKIGLGNASPLIIDKGDNHHETKLLTQSADGNLKQVLENIGPGFIGRQSWRLLE